MGPPDRIPQRDVDILRGLAERKAEIAALPVQQERSAHRRALNNLNVVTPLVTILSGQTPWDEIEVEEALALHTEHPVARGLERQLRREQYMWDHMQCHMVVGAGMGCPIAVRDTGFGLPVREATIRHSDSVSSHHYEPQITCEADVAKIKDPVVTVDWEATERNLQRLRRIFDGILTVNIGRLGGGWFAPWDLLVQWYGVQESLMDMIVRPDLVHATMDRLVSAYCRRLDQWEALHLLGPAGDADDFPRDDFDPDNVIAADCWTSGAAQIFDSVSPEMHEEFAVRHERRWTDRFGLLYYGCCEPLHHKVPMLRETMRNLRKISMSPWADLDVAARNVGTDFVVAFKPNPAHVAGTTWDPGLVRDYLRESLARLRGCVVEVVLKDISTVCHEPRRLWEWADIATEVAEEYS